MLFGVLRRLHEYATGQEKELQIFYIDMLGFFVFFKSILHYYRAVNKYQLHACWLLCSMSQRRKVIRIQLPWK